MPLKGVTTETAPTLTMHCDITHENFLLGGSKSSSTLPYPLSHKTFRLPPCRVSSSPSIRCSLSLFGDTPQHAAVDVVETQPSTAMIAAVAAELTSGTQPALPFTADQFAVIASMLAANAASAGQPTMGIAASVTHVVPQPLIQPPLAPPGSMPGSSAEGVVPWRVFYRFRPYSALGLPRWDELAKAFILQEAAASDELIMIMRVQVVTKKAMFVSLDTTVEGFS